MTRVTHTMPLMLKAGAVAALLACSGLAMAQSANKPLETLTDGMMLPDDATHRVYVMDTVFDHLTDSRLNIFDGNSGKFLGMIPTSFNGHMQVSHDGKKIYTMTSYHERVTRGKRSDVVEIWGASSLAFEKEILLPATRVQGLNYDGMFRQTTDGDFIILQNATPAASVSVVDANKAEFVQEITATTGCWSVIPLPNKPRSFMTICGDGALMQLDLGDDGKLANQHRTKQMFSVEDDPIFIQAAIRDDRAHFVSFYGNVYTVDFSGDELALEDAWSLLDDDDRAQGWAPGGYNLIDVHRDTNRLFVLMHPDAGEGTHKNPAQEIWIYDLESKKRLARVPGRDALSISIDQRDEPRLLTLDGGNVTIYDISGDEPKEIITIEGAGEAALQVLSHPIVKG